MNTSTGTEVATQPQDAAAGSALVPDAPQKLMPFSTQDASQFALAQRQAVAMSKSDLVPAIYKDKPANVLIALELAGRLDCSPLMLMQNLAIGQGKPSFSGQFLIALVNASPRFDRLKFEVQGGSDPKAKTYKVRAYATHLATGEVCTGAWIDWPMVEGEGWSTKGGSKWKTMPEQMFMYRAAAFWSRVFSPEISIGLMSREEVEDVYGIGAVGGKVQRTDALKAALLGGPAPDQVDAEVVDVTPSAATTAHREENAPLTFAEVEGNLLAAQTTQALDEAADLIRELADKEDRAKLGDLYQLRFEKLEAAAAGATADLLGDKPAGT